MPACLSCWADAASNTLSTPQKPAASAQRPARASVAVGSGPPAPRPRQRRGCGRRGGRGAGARRVPDESTQELAELVDACLATDPNLRPSAEQILELLATIDTGPDAQPAIQF